MRITSVALLSLLMASALASTAAGRLPILNDDYARARAQAIQRHVPVFVEVWAPW